jgi:hypothetical protein
MAAQVCFDSTTFYVTLIISSAIFVYCLLNTPGKQLLKLKLNSGQPVLVSSIPAPLASRPSLPPSRYAFQNQNQHQNNYENYVDDSRDFETRRFFQPMMPPLRRGPLNLGPGGNNARRYGYGVFNQMGFLHNPDNEDQAMPLMGRRLHSQQFEYYTFHHNNPDIKIPIKITGDKEISDGEAVNLDSYGNGGRAFRAKIYELDTPRYVPF